MKKNEGMSDRLIRLVIGLLLLIGGYFWLHGAGQIIVYIIAIIALVTSVTGFCALYPLLKINTFQSKHTSLWKVILGIIVVLVVGGIFAFLSNFFSRKFFLEDFATMNDSYKQLLFNSGKEKRAESISYYDKLIPAYAQSQKKYSNYQPLVLRGDKQLVSDLQKVALLLSDIKGAVYSGDLLVTHKKLEEVRPIFQDMFKRNGISLLAVVLVDFHDIMEEIIAGADAKDVQKIISTYPRADEKLKEIELELNDAGIQAIRKNLDAILDMANNNQVDLLSKQAQDLKTSFVKVYLIKG
ncbi:MAG: DUF2892 domain-containing protein [candidate division SR1 bacterium]|nr:DUF2892 domain-containing protein [candidate division SR1 bacterium]